MSDPVLRYDEGNLYFLSDSPKGFQIPGVVRKKKEGASGYIIPDDYPRTAEALKKFKYLFPKAKATPEAKEYVNQIKSIPDRISNLEYVNYYSEVFKNRSPFPFQMEDIEAMIHFDRMALLLEQGLGKTYISLMAMEIMKQVLEGNFRVLVLAPQIVLFNWYYEALRFSSFSPLIYKGDVLKRIELHEELPKYDLIITNYETLVESKKLNTGVLYEWWVRQPFNKRQEISPEYAELKDTKKYKMDVAKMLKDRPESRSMYDVKRNIADLKVLQDQQFDCVIMDEGSRVKGAKASRSKAVLELTKDIPRRYILSGTLCLGDPRDVYMPFTILDDTIFGMNYYMFLHRYTQKSPYNKHIVVGYKNMDELKRKINPYIISRKREDDLSLPQRIESERYFELSDEQVELYNQIIEKDEIEYKGETINTGITIVKINKLLQVVNGFIYSTPTGEAEECGECEHVVECVLKDITPAHEVCINHTPEFNNKKPILISLTGGTPKLDLLKQDLQDLVETEKVIVWANYRHDLQGIKDTLDKAKIAYITPETENCDRIFEESSDIRVFLGQVKQGIGITLNSATTTIYYSHVLSLEDRLQSMDRNYRIGQTKPVLIRDYIGDQSIEADIVELLHKKEEIKDIIQKKPKCLLCEYTLQCAEKKIEPYRSGCVLRQEVNDKVKKNNIRIKPIIK